MLLKMKKPRPYVLLFISAVIAVSFNCIPLSAAAAVDPAKKNTCLKEFAVLSGFGRGDLAYEQDYEIIPTIFRFGIDLKPILNKTGKDPKALAEFEVEPFVSAITSPDTNIEAGANLLFKYGYFVNKKLCPYVEGGAGVIYMTQHVRQQSTQFNFVPQAGLGIYYFINGNLAVNAGYRRRHISNCAIKRPNRGIDTDTILAGLSWFF